MKLPKCAICKRSLKEVEIQGDSLYLDDEGIEVTAGENICSKCVIKNQIERGAKQVTKEGWGQNEKTSWRIC